MGSASRIWTALVSSAMLIPALLASATESVNPHSAVEYVALGDSYASGYGAPPYEEYGRSRTAYPKQLDGRMRIDLQNFEARAGATTADLLEHQLHSLDEETDLVTITVGGNDIAWGAAVAACLFGTDSTCRGAIDQAEGLIDGALPEQLNAVYNAVVERAEGAHVVVVGYPRLFSPGFGNDYRNASVEEQRWANAAADRLNAVIAQVAEDNGLQFVDVTRRFDGHGVGAPDPWILDWVDDGSSFHPTERGYRAYTAAITAELIPARLR